MLFYCGGEFMNERIREIRKDFGLSQKDFGKKLGVSRNVIANIENSRVIPDETLIKLLSIEFNVNREWLETGIGEKESSPLSIQDIKLADMFSEMTLDKNSKLRSIVEKLYDLDDEYIDILEKLIIGLTK